MKNPDEIKKGLECCRKSDSRACTRCAYRNTPMSKFCQHMLEEDALALIQQLTEEGEAAIRRANVLMERVQQLEAERDAAVKDIKEAHNAYCMCVTCKNYRVNAYCQEPPDTFCPNCPHDNCSCKGCSSKMENWEWRGVQKEE